MKKPVRPAARRPPAPEAQRAPWPWDDIHLDLAEISGIKAIAAQHPIGFKAILEKLCRVDLRSMTPGGEDGRRATDYAEGMRGVGRQLRAIVAMPMPTNSRSALPNSPTPGVEPASQ